MQYEDAPAINWNGRKPINMVEGRAERGVCGGVEGVHPFNGHWRNASQSSHTYWFSAVSTPLPEQSAAAHDVSAYTGPVTRDGLCTPGNSAGGGSKSAAAPKSQKSRATGSRAEPERGEETAGPSKLGRNASGLYVQKSQRGWKGVARVRRQADESAVLCRLLVRAANGQEGQQRSRSCKGDIPMHKCLSVFKGTNTNVRT
eukprot:scaffold225622_cov25-Tisochrysis_lutea.AAC.1